VIPADLERGDLLQIEWLDITEDPVGNPDQPKLAHRHSIGFFWTVGEDAGVRTLVTTTTLESDDEVENSGYCVYPEGTVHRVKIIKRKRRRRKAVAPAVEVS